MNYGCPGESAQAPGDSEGQGSLACCSPWGRKESDTTERLNNRGVDRVKVLCCSAEIHLHLKGSWKMETE